MTTKLSKKITLAEALPAELTSDPRGHQRLVLRLELPPGNNSVLERCNESMSAQGFKPFVCAWSGQRGGSMSYETRDSNTIGRFVAALLANGVPIRQAIDNLELPPQVNIEQLLAGVNADQKVARKVSV